MCNHRNLKKNYPFGRKSKPDMFCKNCNKVVKPSDMIRDKLKNKLRRIK